MKLRHWMAGLFVVLTLQALCACAVTPASSPAGSPTSSSSPTPSPSSTTPVETALPSSTSTPTTASQLAAVLVAADQNVYVWSDGGSSFTQITTSGDAQTAVISTDGRRIAYSRTQDNLTYTLDIVDFDGANHRVLFTQADFLGIKRPPLASTTKPLQFAWVPNSHKLALTLDYVMEGPGVLTVPEMLLLNADEGIVQTLLSENENYQFYISPDGSKIAIVLPDGIDLFDSKGNQLLSPKLYTFTAINTSSEAAYLPAIVWMPDSSSFAFTVPPSEPFTNTQALTRVVKIDAQNGKASTLLTASMAFQMPQVLSPDLTQIAYLQAANANSNEFDLHIDNLEGDSGAVYASGTMASDFSWSPDNLHFVYSVASGAALQAFSGQIDQSPVQIKEISDARGFAWLDASRYLVIDKTITGWKIWLGNIGGPLNVLYSDSLLSGTELSLQVNR